MAENPNSEHAHRLQEKFDFYSVALPFAILGLSVQTYAFGRGRASDAAELLGWVLLLVSGLVGLSRLSWQPQLFQVFSERADREKVISDMNKLTTQGHNLVGVFGSDKTVPVLEIKSKAEKALVGLTEKADRLVEGGVRKYRWQRNLFVAGLVALMISRGLPVLVGLFGYRLIP